MVFNGLAGSNKPDAVPDLKASESAAPEESAASEELAEAGATESAAGAVYIFDDAGFSGAPVWSIKEPQGWTKEPVKEGMVNYRNASLQCTFTTYQATIEPTGGTDDEAATKLVMASEIEAVKSSVGKPVEVIDEDAVNSTSTCATAARKSKCSRQSSASRTTAMPTLSTGWPCAQPAAATG